MSIMRWIVLLTAILVWVNIYAFVDRTKTLDAPVVIENLSQNLAIAEPITTVETTVNGKLRDISKLSDETLQFSIDATKITGIGQFLVTIKPKLVPKNIKVISFTPKELTINIETVSSKTIDVIALSKGSSPDNYSVRSLTSTPSQVLVFGAVSLLDKISQAHVYVDIANRRSSFVVPGEPIVQDAHGKVIQSVHLSPDVIKVNVEIVTGSSIRNLGIRPNFIGELPGGFWVQEVVFNPPIAQVRGPQSKLSTINFLVSTPINLNDRRTNFSEQVAVDLPDGIEMVGDSIVMAEIIIGSGEGTRQLDIVPQYANVTEGFGVTTITPTSVQLVISGDPRVVNQIKRSDIQLKLDLRGSLSGTNKITITPAMFVVPANIQVVSFTPDTVEVVISRL